MNRKLNSELLKRANSFLKVGSLRGPNARYHAMRIWIPLFQGAKRFGDRDRTNSRQVANGCLVALFGMKPQDIDRHYINRWNYWPKSLLRDMQPRICDLDLGWKYEGNQIEFYAVVELRFRESELLSRIQCKFADLVKSAIRESLPKICVGEPEEVTIGVKLDCGEALCIETALKLAESGRHTTARRPLEEIKISKSEDWLASCLLSQINAKQLLLETMLECDLRRWRSLNLAMML